MRSTKVTVVASVLAGLMLPAGIAVATGKLRESRERKPPATERTSAEVFKTLGQHNKPEVQKPVEKPPVEKPPVDTTAPALIVYSPEKGARFSEPVATVKGAAEVGSLVKVNGEHVDTDEDGKFSRDVKLYKERNVIVVKAYDAAGNRSIREIAVYYDAPVVPLPTKSPWEKPPVDTTGFTANQKFGTSTADPPSDVFFGTGKPGSEVKVKSEYGYVYTTIGHDGTWEVTLVFQGLTAGKTIPVWIKLNGQYMKEFHFTWTPEPEPSPST